MSSVVIAGNTSGSITISAPDVSGSNTLTLPVATDTLVGKATTDTLTNKTLVAPTITGLQTLNTPNTFGFKNRIINGGMVIDQRNAGASVTPTASGYTLDRWQLAIAQASKLSFQQNAGAVTPPVGFSNYIGLTSLSAYSITSTDYFILTQAVEGYNIADLAWGTASAATVTLSFQVRSSLTGTFGGVVTNGVRAYPFTYTVGSANTWTAISITIAGDTSGTWATNNTTGLIVQFGLGVGSTRSGTAGSWATGTYNSATGATSVVGTSGATFYITGVQLEKGSTATSFDFRDYGRELAMCQRYFQVLASGTNKVIGMGWYWTATELDVTIPLITTMRAAPSLLITTGTNYYKYIRTSDLFDSLTIDGQETTDAVNLYTQTGVSGTVGLASAVSTNNALAFIGFTSEL